MKSFVEKVRELIRDSPRERILNIDETNRRTIAPGFKMWALVGAESVHCRVDNDEKQGVTVIAANNAAGEKLPLKVSGNGKTRRCLVGYELPSEVWRNVANLGGQHRRSCVVVFGI
jgi:hypothetical protein